MREPLLFCDVQPEAGPERFCQGLALCAASGQSFACPFISIGLPSTKVVVWCTTCERFICGICALRQAVEIKIADSGNHVTAWQLTCPRCLQALGQVTYPCVVHSGDIGIVGTCIQCDGGLRAVSPSCAESIATAVWQHEQRARQILAGSLSRKSPPAVLAQIELAIAEGPSESVAWFYKAAICHRAGLGVAAGRALRQLHRIPLGPPLSTAPERSALRSAFHHLTGPEKDVPTGLGSLSAFLAKSLGRQQQLTNNLVDLEHLFEMRPRLKAAEDTLGKLLRRDAAQAWREFLALIENWRGERITMGEYVHALFANSTNTRADIEEFQEVVDIERHLVVAPIERERTQLLDAILQRLSKDEKSILLEKAVQSRLGQITQTEFYRYLDGVARQLGLALHHYRALGDYMRYVERAEAIDRSHVLELAWAAQEESALRLAGASRGYTDFLELGRVYLLRECLKYLTESEAAISHAFEESERPHQVPKLFQVKDFIKGT